MWPLDLDPFDRHDIDMVDRHVAWLMDSHFVCEVMTIAHKEGIPALLFITAGVLLLQLLWLKNQLAVGQK